MSKPKIGLITTMSQDTTWPQSMVDKVQMDQQQAFHALEAMGMEVVLGSKGLARTKAEMTAAGNALREAGAEAVVVYVGCWTYANVTVELACLIDLPIMIWTNSGQGNIGIVGAAVARGSLEEIGVRTKLVHGDFYLSADTEKNQDMVRGCGCGQPPERNDAGPRRLALHGHVHGLRGSVPDQEAVWNRY